MGEPRRHAGCSRRGGMNAIFLWAQAGLPQHAAGDPADAHAAWAHRGAVRHALRLAAQWPPRRERDVAERPPAPAGREPTDGQSHARVARGARARAPQARRERPTSGLRRADRGRKGAHSRCGTDLHPHRYIQLAVDTALGAEAGAPATSNHWYDEDECLLEMDTLEGLLHKVRREFGDFARLHYRWHPDD